jgi:hypothetical protein
VCEADHSPPSSAEVRNGGAIPLLPHTYPWHGAEAIKNGDNFPFFLYIVLLCSCFLIPKASANGIKKWYVISAI